MLYHALPIFTLSENTYVKSSFVSLEQERVEQERVEHKHGESIQTTSILMHMITNDDDE